MKKHRIFIASFIALWVLSGCSSTTAEPSNVESNSSSTTSSQSAASSKTVPSVSESSYSSASSAASQIDGSSTSDTSSQINELEKATSLSAADDEDALIDFINQNNTLETLADFQIEEFELIAEDAANRVKNKEMTIEEADVYSEQMVGMDIAALVFPSNGVELFRQWKDETGYYEQFESEDVESSSSSSSQTEQNEQIVDTQKPDTSVKPKPSEEQKADQVENNTSGGSTDNGDDSNVIPGMEEVPDGTVWGTEDNNGTWINADYIRDRLPDYLKE